MIEPRHYYEQSPPPLAQPSPVVVSECASAAEGARAWHAREKGAGCGGVPRARGKWPEGESPESRSESPELRMGIARIEAHRPNPAVRNRPEYQGNTRGIPDIRAIQPKIRLIPFYDSGDSGDSTPPSGHTIQFRKVAF